MQIMSSLLVLFTNIFQQIHIYIKTRISPDINRIMTHRFDPIFKLLPASELLPHTAGVSEGSGNMTVGVFPSTHFEVSH